MTRTALVGSCRSLASSSRRKRWPWVGDQTATPSPSGATWTTRSEEHTSELQSHSELVCRLLLEKKKKLRFRQTTNRLESHARPSGRRTGRAHTPDRHGH